MEVSSATSAATSGITQSQAPTDALSTSVMKLAMKSQSDSLLKLMQGMGVGRNLNALA